MIRVSVTPATFIAGQRAVLTIELANTGGDVVSDVVFRLKLPPGMALVSGPGRIDVDTIRARQAHVHRVTVLPGQPGDFEVGTANFSYRDKDDIPQTGDDWRAAIRVLAGQSAPGAPAPARSSNAPRAWPHLTVSRGAARLALDAWCDLEVVLHNGSGVPVHDVTLTIAGPFRVDRASHRIRQLRDGETGRARISVYIPDRGEIPVHIRTTYRYRDERGQLSSGWQDDKLTADVAAPVEPAPARDDEAPVTTILYLVAQPRNLTELDSYREMREVERLLWLGPHPERYRLKHGVAARLQDIGQALGSWPQVVHFSGHGKADGSLAVENNFGNVSYADPAGLAELLGGFAASLRCVIVNACHSLILAKAVNVHIDYVVGMRSEILDSAGVQFSVGFYQGLFAGKTVPAAFRQGVAMIRAEPTTNSEYQVPILLVRPGAPD